MITFETQEAFEKAVLDCISNKMNLLVSVSGARSRDSFSSVFLTDVGVTLTDDNGKIMLNGYNGV